jgi:raffinose/stachyose/melibiose transport system substrate-binding protein
LNWPGNIHGIRECNGKRRFYGLKNEKSIRRNEKLFAVFSELAILIFKIILQVNLMEDSIMTKAIRISLFIACMAFLTLSSAWAGGGGGDKSGTVTTLPPGAKSLDKFTITYFDFNEDPSVGNDRTKSFYANVEKLFKGLYPNSTLELTGLDAGQSGLDVLQMQFASGTGPDVFEFQNRIVPFAQAGYLYDLSNESWAKDVVEPAFPEVKYNGKIYAAPNRTSGWGLFYNKSIYEDKLGLSVPKNFQEFLDNCEKIKKAGYAPLVTGGADGWPFFGIFNSFHSFIFGANKNFPIDLYNGKVSLAGKEMTDMFNAIKLCYDKGYFSEATMSLPWGGSLQHLGEGKAVMAFMPGGMNLADEGYDIDVGFFYIPDYNGYNCLPVTADTSYGVNAKYKFASTYGADLIKCLIDDSSLHILNDNAAPVGYKNKSIAFNNLTGKMYQQAFDKGPVVMQISSWIPTSANLGMQIVSSILSGTGFSQAMLEEMQRNYQADKGQVNYTSFN